MPDKEILNCKLVNCNSEDYIRKAVDAAEIKFVKQLCKLNKIKKKVDNLKFPKFKNNK